MAKQTAWLSLVKDLSRKNPGKKLKDILRMAKKVYKKTKKNRKFSKNRTGRRHRGGADGDEEPSEEEPAEEETAEEEPVAKKETAEEETAEEEPATEETEEPELTVGGKSRKAKKLQKKCGGKRKTKRNKN
jgi:hypothetical protein